MTSSLEIAQECLKVDESLSNEQTASQQTFEGLESFAQTIESGMNTRITNYMFVTVIQYVIPTNYFVQHIIYITLITIDLEILIN